MLRGRKTQTASRWVGRLSATKLKWAPLALLFGYASAGSFELPAAEPSPQATNLSSGMDLSIQPGNDFFDYANGVWLQETPIPPDRSSIGIFSQLADISRKRVADLIHDIGATARAADPLAQQVADYYNAVMDEKGIEAARLSPLQPTLQRIRAIKDAATLARFLGTTLRADVDILNNGYTHTDHIFGLWVAQDLNDPSRYAPFLVQGGLGMPDRDYYISDSPQMRELQQQYQSYVANLLRLSGTAAKDADAQAKRIYELERRIAEVHVSVADTEDVQRGNNHWRRGDFSVRAPGLDWQAFFESAQLEKQNTFIVWQPSALIAISALTKSVPTATWKEYLRFHALDHFAGLLPKAFVEAHFAFYGTAVEGTPQLPDRWKRAVGYTNEALGDAVGRLYVQRYFSLEAKQSIERLVKNLMDAFAAHIDSLEWMAPETRVEAKAKLSALKVGVGYPDRWRDYAALKVSAGDAFGNAERAEIFAYQTELAKLMRTEVDRSEWVLSPQTVNAVNLPVMNALNFPAAILQAPFFDAGRPAVLNYGSIGAIIGHEISHSFDNQGAQFDSKGKLRNWWKEQDYAHFEQSSGQLVAQFNAYKPFPDLSVNVKQTLGENIADLAGLSVSFSAYRSSLDGVEAAPLAGFTGDQQFFLSFAQGWRGKYRDPQLRETIITDGHAPDRYRSSTVRNVEPWYKAFDVKPNQSLYLPPGERVHMW
jgi:putative endopeptidase